MWMIFTLVGLVIVVGVAGILIYAAMLPKDFQVSRSIAIDAPPETIFPLINDLRRFNEWNPFAKQDPTIAITYDGSREQAGLSLFLNGRAVPTQGAGDQNVKTGRG